MPAFTRLKRGAVESSIPFPDEGVGVLTGSGAFETCRVKEGRVRHLQEHLGRLSASLQTLGIFSWDRLEAKHALEAAARRLAQGYVRLNVRRDGRIVVHANPRIPYGKRRIWKGLSLTTVPTRWPPGKPETAQVKMSERLGSILGRFEGGEAEEVLRIGPHGYVTEGTVSNLFLVKEKTVVTPPRWVGVLEGVTRGELFRAAARLGIPFAERPMSRHDLFNADELFMTNVLMGIFPVRSLDGRQIGRQVPGPLTRRLMRELERREG